MNNTTNKTEKANPVILLIIDPQVDFHEGGSLAVSGAKADSERIAEMIKNNIESIDEIYVTLDSHHVNHIAHQSFWEWGHAKGISEFDPQCDIKEKKDGEASITYTPDTKIRPKHFASITSQDIIAGIWLPVDRSLRDYCIRYAKQLESKQRFTLCIWPNHCLIGTVGHSVVPNINAALQEWTRRKMKIVNFVHKGMNCLTEMYSAIEAEVPVPTDPGTMRNNVLLDKLRHCKRLVVCGQAKSHCVHWTVRDIVKDWVDEGLQHELSKIHVLEDAMSNVGGFEPWGVEFIDLMRQEKVTVTTTKETFLDISKEY